MRGEIKDVLVLIPVYKNELTANERMSLQRTLRVLHRYDITFIKPSSFDFNAASFTGTERKFGIESFDDRFFKDVKGYNKLLIDEMFYSRFTNRKYILICQLDVFLLKDDLMKWVNKNYDYIGAPWPSWEIRRLRKHHLKNKLRYLRFFMGIINLIFFNKRDYMIGNGGLSLRKVKTSLAATRRFKNFTKKWKANEDVFWSMLVPLLNPFFRIPNCKKGMGFAFEKEPSHFFKLNNGELPFGVHAWDKHEPEFWKPVIDQLEGALIYEEAVNMTKII